MIEEVKKVLEDEKDPLELSKRGRDLRKEIREKITAKLCSKKGTKTEKLIIEKIERIADELGEIQTEKSLEMFLQIFEDILLEIDLDLVSSTFAIFEQKIKIFTDVFKLGESSGMSKKKLKELLSSLQKRIPHSFDAILRGRILMLLMKLLPLNESLSLGRNQNLKRKYFVFRDCDDKEEKENDFMKMREFMNCPEKLMKNETLEECLQIMHKIEEDKLNIRKMVRILSNKWIPISGPMDSNVKKMRSDLSGHNSIDFNIMIFRIIILLQHIQQKKLTNRQTEDLKSLISQAFRNVEINSKLDTHLITKIVERNLTWVQWHSMSYPLSIFEFRYSDSPSRHSTKSQSIPAVIKKPLQNPFNSPFLKWPDSSPSDPIKMGNLILQDLWKGSMCARDANNFSNPFAEDYKNSRDYISTKEETDGLNELIKSNEESGSSLLPDLNREKDKVFELMREGTVKEERLPKLMKFRLLRLLRESDFDNLHKSRGEIGKMR